MTTQAQVSTAAAGGKKLYQCWHPSGSIKPRLVFAANEDDAVLLAQRPGWDDEERARLGIDYCFAQLLRFKDLAQREPVDGE